MSSADCETCVFSHQVIPLADGYDPEFHTDKHDVLNDLFSDRCFFDQVHNTKQLATLKVPYSFWSVGAFPETALGEIMEVSLFC